MRSPLPNRPTTRFRRWSRTRDEELGYQFWKIRTWHLLSGLQRRGIATLSMNCECCGERDWRGKDDVLQILVQTATMANVADDQRRG